MTSPKLALILVLGACGGDSSSDTPMVDAAGPLGPDASAPDADSPPQVRPSNGLDLRPTGLLIAPPTGAFSTTTDCTTPSILGACEAVTPPHGPAVCACRADRFTIGDLRVTGERALVLLAHDTIVVGGTLDVGGHGATPGPGAATGYADAATSLSGGAGGSHASRGGNAGAAAYGETALEPLVGGMPGQAGCNSTRGGGGGGAVQLSAGTAITISGTIDAGGGGGNGGSSTGTCLGGPGGGAGGAILVEAPVVTVTGRIAANGGGGGGGGSNDYGSGGAGADGRTGGYGGSGNDDRGCALQGYTGGGDGGRGAAGTFAAASGQSWDSVSGCIGGTTYVGSGGGGGGIGRIRVNTATGCQCAGMFSPAPSIGTLVIR